MTPKVVWKAFRDALTGRFLRKEEAEQRPPETVVEETMERGA